jgi:hypothetical protein
MHYNLILPGLVVSSLLTFYQFPVLLLIVPLFPLVAVIIYLVYLALYAIGYVIVLLLAIVIKLL